MKFLIILFTLFCLTSFAQEGPMNNKRMAVIIRAEVEKVEGEDGAWQIFYGGKPLMILTDEPNNRMRIFSPILEEEKLEEGQMKKLLEANFHSALDAKYSLYNGFVISVFTHPLGALQKDQFIDAMQQVVNLSENFGTSYSSTGLIFGGGVQGEEENKDERKINKKPKSGK
jgi:hypothetical protein